MNKSGGAQASSLLHPAIAQLKTNGSMLHNKGEAPQHLATEGIKAGYAGAVYEISTRFDVNNREMNKRRFNDQYAHIVQASKTRAVKTKFRFQEVCMSLTPENDLSAEVELDANKQGG